MRILRPSRFAPSRSTREASPACTDAAQENATLNRKFLCLSAVSLAQTLCNGVAVVSDWAARETPERSSSLLQAQVELDSTASVQEADHRPTFILQGAWL